MAHFVYTRPGGIWATLYVPAASDFQSLDQQIFKAINGDDGGTWNPTTPLTIGGAGLALGAPAEYSPPLPVSRVVSCTSANCTYFLTAAGGGDPAVNPFSFGITISVAALGVNGSPAPSGFRFTTPYATDDSHAYAVRIPLTDALIDGATLTSLAVTFTSSGGHTSLPQSLPCFVLYSAKLNAGSVVAITLIAGPAFDAPGSVSNYNTLTQEMSMATSVVIDKTQYEYFVVITDEHGANAVANNLYYGVALTMTVPDGRPN